MRRTMLDPAPRKRAGFMLLALLGTAVPATAKSSDVGDGGVPSFYTWSGILPGQAGVVLAEETLPAEFSVPLRKSANRLMQRLLVELRPTPVGHPNFGVADLP